MLVELVIVSVMSAILVLAVSALMVDSHKGYNTISSTVNSDMALSDLAARKIFSSMMRQCSKNADATSIDPTRKWIRTQYYSSPEAESLDRYARLYLQGNELILEKGVISPASVLSSQTVCQHVSSVVFKKNGRSVFMFLELNDGTDIRKINTSALLCNP